MIQQFRSINPINILLLIGFAAFLRIGLFLDLPDHLNFEFGEPFARLLLAVPQENTFNTSANLVISLIVLIIQALIFNRIINHYNLLGKSTYLPALLFVAVASLLTPFLPLSPALMCNFLALWMVEKFLSIYKRAEVTSVMYDLGLIVALGTLLYFPFIGMVLVVWISLIIFRPFNWREWVAVIIGFITIFFFLAVYYYWNDSLNQFYDIWVPLATPFPTNLKINLYDFLVLIPLILILAMGVIMLQQNFFRSVVQLRKSFQLLFFMFLGGLFTFYLKEDLRLYHFLICVPPAAVLMAYYFVHARKRWVFEGLFVIFVAFILYFQVV